MFHLRKLRLYPWLPSLPCKACAIRASSARAKSSDQRASGEVGTFAVQITKAFGAEVTAVCNTRNLEMARLIVADHVIDYTKEGFTQNGRQYDLILSAYKRALTPQGIYVFTGGLPAQTFQALFLGPLMSKSDGRKMTSITKKQIKKNCFS